MNGETLRALAEPTRFKMVELLKKGPMAVNDIADFLQIRQPQASKHLKVLSGAGVVSIEVQANRRFYKLNPTPFRELEEWATSYSQLWEDRFDRLDQYLEEMKVKQTENEHKDE